MSLLSVITADDLLVLMGKEINNFAPIPETQVKHERRLRNPAEKQVSV